MMNELKKYSAYKDSGVPWLGEVPEHWSLSPNRALIRRRKTLVGQRHSEYRLLSLTKKGIIVRDVEGGKGKFTADMSTFQEVHDGDLVFCLFDIPETPRTVGLAHDDGMITGAYTVFECPDATLAAFFNLFYQAMDDRKMLSPLYSGLRNTIQPTRFLAIKTPTPPSLEQSSIVRFLDYTDRRIKRCILAKQKMIKLLEEQKQAIIHRAVTCGIDPNVRLKKSGVDWLGNVPEHWEVKKLKHLTRFYNGIPFKPGDWHSTGIPIIRIQNLNGSNEFNYTNKDDLPEFLRISPGDLLFSWSGNVGTSFGSFIWDRDFEGYLNQHIFKLAGYSLNRRYFAHLLRAVTKHVEQQTHGIIGLVHVTKPELGAVCVPVAPPEEQIAIARYIDDSVIDLNTVGDRVRREISLLREYRTRLIADVVTGKIDVREAVKNLPEELKETDSIEEVDLSAEGDGGDEEQEATSEEVEA